MHLGITGTMWPLPDGTDLTKYTPYVRRHHTKLLEEIEYYDRTLLSRVLETTRFTLSKRNPSTTGYDQVILSFGPTANIILRLEGCQYLPKTFATEEAKHALLGEEMCKAFKAAAHDLALDIREAVFSHRYTNSTALSLAQNLEDAIFKGSLVAEFNRKLKGTLAGAGEAIPKRFKKASIRLFPAPKKRREPPTKTVKNKGEPGGSGAGAGASPTATVIAPAAAPTPQRKRIRTRSPEPS